MKVAIISAANLVVAELSCLFELNFNLMTTISPPPTLSTALRHKVSTTTLCRGSEMTWLPGCSFGEVSMPLLVYKRCSGVNATPMFVPSNSHQAAVDQRPVQPTKEPSSQLCREENVEYSVPPSLSSISNCL